MHHFVYRQGTLHAEEVSLAELAASVGTPFYCYSTATLRRHIRVFADAFAGRAQGFKEALLHARDYLGFALARVIEDLRPEGLTFGRIYAALLAADREMSDGRYAALIHESFGWRGISLRA